MKQDMEVLSGLFTVLYETNSLALLHLVHPLLHVLGVIENPTGRLVVGVRPGFLWVPVSIVCVGVTSLSYNTLSLSEHTVQRIPRLEILSSCWAAEVAGGADSSQLFLRSTEPQLNLPDPSSWIQRRLSCLR